MATTRTASRALVAACPTLVAAVVLLMASGFAAAAPDPSLCPFELGYNPVFNADGSVLSCTKGQETFVVDEAGILARSLRGIGTSIKTILSGIIDNDLSVFGRFIEASAVIELPDGDHHVDDAVLAFTAEAFVFPPGADKSAIFQVTQYQFLDNNDPRVASVHVTVFGSKYTINFDSIWRFNLVNGSRVWQLYQTLHLNLVPV